MAEPAPAPSPSDTPTLQQQWILIGVVAAVMMFGMISSLIFFPEETSQDRHTPGTIFAGLAMAFGHAAWISMDRRRRGHEVGGWRFFAIFFGPLAVWIYLILEYRARALYLIPLSLMIYATALTGGIVGVVTLTLWRQRP